MTLPLGKTYPVEVRPEFGNFEDEEDRQDFIRQVNDPEARARRSKKRGLR